MSSNRSDMAWSINVEATTGETRPAAGSMGTPVRAAADH